MAGRSAPKESVWFNEFDLFQYSLALSILKYLGQVLLARHRRKMPSVCPVIGSVITGKVCGNSYSCEKCRECCCWLTVGCEKAEIRPHEPARARRVGHHAIEHHTAVFVLVETPPNEISDLSAAIGSAPLIDGAESSGHRNWVGVAE